MINNVTLMGRLTADAELRTTPSDVFVTRFNIAVDRNTKEKKADFIAIVAWRNTAEFICNYFHKGDMIALTGSIQTGTYEKDGQKRNTFEVVADNVSFCGSKSESKPTNDFAPVVTMDDEEDMLPF